VRFTPFNGHALPLLPDFRGQAAEWPHRGISIMTKKYSGRCACGNVTFEFNTDPTFIADCYCLDCRKASGGAMATFFAVPQEDFTVLRDTPKAFHYTAESGHGLDRDFCPDCGARLFTSNLGSFPGLVFVMFGSLDQAERIAPKLEMFTKRRPPWTHALELPQFASMPS
jgi:hypothetical protein